MYGQILKSNILSLLYEQERLKKKHNKQFAIERFYIHLKNSGSVPENTEGIDDTDSVKSNTKVISILTQDLNQSRTMDLMKTSNTNGYVGYDLKYELLVQEDITYISHEETFAHTNERLNIIIIYHIRNKRSPRIIDSKNCVQEKLKQENMTRRF